MGKVKNAVDAVMQMVSKEKSDGLVPIDLGDKEIALGKEIYRGKVRVSPAVLDQLVSMIPHVKNETILLKDMFSKK